MQLSTGLGRFDIRAFSRWMCFSRAVATPQPAHSGHRRGAFGFLNFITIALTVLTAAAMNLQADEPILQVGLAEVEITPPLGFPMAGYYHERLATATHDPLWSTLR